MKQLTSAVQTKDARKWTYFDDIKVCLYVVNIPAGTTQVIYKYKRNTSPLNVAPDGFSIMQTVSVVPPGGHVRIHSTALADTGDWPGSWELVGGGIHPAGDYSFEAVKDSTLLCATPYSKLVTERQTMTRVFLKAGEEYTAPSKSKALIIMHGFSQGKAYTFIEGEKYTARTDTLLANVIALIDEEEEQQPV